MYLRSLLSTFSPKTAADEPLLEACSQRIFHLLPTENFPKKLTFLTTRIHKGACAFQEVRNVSCSENE